MSSAFYTPKFNGQESAFERDFLTRYYDSDAISSIDIKELSAEYHNSDFVLALTNATADDFISTTEKVNLQNLGVSAAFFETFRSGMWAATAKSYINTSWKQIDYSDSERAELINNFAQRSAVGVGAIELALAAQPENPLEIRLSALHALQTLGEREEFPVILNALSDSNSQIKNVAVQILTDWVLYRPESVDFNSLVDTANNHPSIETRIQAIRILGHWYSQAAVEFLSTLISNDHSPAIRQSAVDAFYLSEYPSPIILTSMRIAAADTTLDGNTRARAFSYIVSHDSGNPENLELMASAASDTDPDVRRFALHYFLGQHTAQAEIKVVGFMADQNYDISFQAAKACAANMTSPQKFKAVLNWAASEYQANPSNVDIDRVMQTVIKQSPDMVLPMLVDRAFNSDNTAVIHIALEYLFEMIRTSPKTRELLESLAKQSHSTELRDFVSFLHIRYVDQPSELITLAQKTQSPRVLQLVLRQLRNYYSYNPKTQQILSRLIHDVEHAREIPQSVKQSLIAWNSPRYWAIE